MKHCARDGCDEPVPTTNKRGRPAIYCSPACRPSATTTTSRRSVSVELTAPAGTDDTRPTGRVFSVQLRRGTRAVVIATDLGRLSASALVAEINALLNPIRREGGAID